MRAISQGNLFIGVSPLERLDGVTLPRENADAGYPGRLVGDHVRVGDLCLDLCLDPVSYKKTNLLQEYSSLCIYRVPCSGPGCVIIT